MRRGSDVLGLAFFFLLAPLVVTWALMLHLAGMPKVLADLETAFEGG